MKHVKRPQPKATTDPLKIWMNLYNFITFTNPKLSYQIHQTKLIKQNLTNQTYQVKPIWIVSAEFWFGDVARFGYLLTCLKQSTPGFHSLSISHICILCTFAHFPTHASMFGLVHRFGLVFLFLHSIKLHIYIPCIFAYLHNYILHIFQHIQRRSIQYHIQQGTHHSSLNKVVSEWVSQLVIDRGRLHSRILTVLKELQNS